MNTNCFSASAHVRLRLATCEDLPRIRMLLEDSQVFPENELEDAVNMLARYVRYPDPRELSTYVYYIGLDLAAMVSYGAGLGEGTYELYWLCVSPKHRERGLGSKLLKFSEDRMAEYGARMIFVETSTNPEYASAQGLYERMGYSKEGIVKDYFADGNHRITYSKRLKTYKR